MPHSYRIRRRVEFSETDMAGIVHFSNFFRYMESVEHAFFRSMGHSIATREEHAIGWPRVHAECDYRRPLRFEDEVEVELLVREVRTRSVSYTMIFRRVLADEATEEVARGAVTAVCVRRNPETGELASVPIPPEIAAQLEVAPGEAGG